MIRVQRIYDNPKGINNDNDFRVLVDRLWPHGLNKDKIKVDLWKKDIAPSSLLREWFNHDEKKWNEFKRRYFKELDRNSDLVSILVNKAHERDVTLLYSSKEERFNNAVALKEYLEEKAKE